MLVCSCFAVSDRTLRSVIASGAYDADEIGARCDAGTGCGGCLEEIDELLDEAMPRRRCPVARSA
ncbi:MULTISPECIES: (2Fe-2S)-binding protein [Parafrankia]|uniref:(2Fe-2S)-binding protein n=1 Tax=Parafrankia TaxID=2994362 RepID=UPI000054377C|nr:(2Fe-2S)-binding protein [Parafrankia soli]ABW11684.1 BFD domain protein (2Fe-2S)-binding domain protein [Frankia sp. EAN1pec]